MWEKLKKDNFWFGLALGIVIPLVVFTIVYMIDDQLGVMQKKRTVIKDSTKVLIAVFFNLILFRIYMVNWKMDKTGRGLLAMTFIWAIMYVILFEAMGEKYLF